MTQRTRKLAGTVALLLFVACYALLAMAAAMMLQVYSVGKAAELAYYVIAGLLWVPPAGVLIKWMQKPEA